MFYVNDDDGVFLQISKRTSFMNCRDNNIYLIMLSRRRAPIRKKNYIYCLKLSASFVSLTRPHPTVEFCPCS